MAIPRFEYSINETSEVLCKLLADRVRIERRRLKLSQGTFSEIAAIPLRTFKRFEQGDCDSLLVFIKVVGAFNRVAALELLFPPQSVVVETRMPAAMLERLLGKLER